MQGGTQQWAKRFFRWVFVKRHTWFWPVFFMFIIGMGISVAIECRQMDTIKMYRSNDIKYRFIKAVGHSSRTVQFLEDAFEEKNADKLEYINSTVIEYERAIRQKSDSIVRAEKKKIEDLR